MHSVALLKFLRSDSIRRQGPLYNVSSKPTPFGLPWGTLGAPSGSLWRSIWMTLGCPWPKRSKSQKKVEKVSWRTPPRGAQNPSKIDAKTKGFTREAQRAQNKSQRHRQSAFGPRLRSPKDFAWKAQLSTKTPKIVEIVSILATILNTFLDTKKT